MAKDMIFPEQIAELQRLYPDVPYEVLGKGPGIWMDSWRAPVAPLRNGFPDLQIAEVSTDNVSSFIANPSLKEKDSDKTRPVLLDKENIQDLLNGISTIARIQPNNAQSRRVQLVRINPTSALKRVSTPAIACDVNDLLVNRRLKINGQSVAVKVTPANIEELMASGMTYLEVEGASSASPVMVVNKSIWPSSFETSQAQPGSEVAAFVSATPVASASGDESWQTTVSAKMLAEPQALAAGIKASFFSEGTLALYLPYQVTWELLGYTRGELLNTISLSPEESATIEVTTWDRRRVENEASATFESKSTSEQSFNAKLTAEAVNQLAHKHDWGLNVHGDVSIPIKTVKVGIGGAWNDTQSIQDTHNGTVSLVQEGLTKTTAQISNTRQTKISQTRETGFDRKDVRTIKNSNLCHTLDLHYFEVLASYKVSVVPLVKQARVCLLVKNPINDPINPAFLLNYESELRSGLLAPEHDSGFDAARMLAALGHVHGYECILRCPAPCACDKPPAAVPAEGATSASDPLAEALGMVAKAAANVRERIKLLNDADVFRDHALDGTHSPDSGICALARDWFGANNHPQSEWNAAIEEWRRWQFREIHLVRHATGFWSECVRYLNENVDTPERLELLLKAGEVGWAAGLNQAVAAIFAGIQTTGINARLTVACNGNLKPLLDHAGFDDAGLDAAMKLATTEIERYNMAKASATATQVVEEAKATGAATVGGNGANGSTDQSASWPYRPRELAEARVAQDALLAHIKTHESYYRQLIWASLGNDDRLLILRLMGNLPRTVEHQVVGFIANDCALPLRLEQFPDVAGWLTRNVVENQALLANPSPITVTLPTRGVTIETRLGQCSTAEDFIEKHRELDLVQKGVEVELLKEKLVQEKIETRRYQARLNAAPPILDEPTPGPQEPVVRVVIDKP